MCRSHYACGGEPSVKATLQSRENKKLSGLEWTYPYVHIIPDSFCDGTPEKKRGQKAHAQRRGKGLPFPLHFALRSLYPEIRHIERARIFFLLLAPARKTTPDWHFVYLYSRSVVYRIGLISCRSEHPKVFTKRLSHGTYTLGAAVLLWQRGCVDD